MPDRATEMEIANNPIAQSFGLSWLIDPSFHENEAIMTSRLTSYVNDTPHWTSLDKTAIFDPASPVGAAHAFRHCPVPLNLYFYHSPKPNYDPFMQYGLCDRKNLARLLGKSSAHNVIDTAYHPDALTVVMTNNLSDERYISIRSNWIIAHRMAHAILGGKRTNAGSNASNAFHDILRRLLFHGYGIKWPNELERLGRMIANDYRDIYGRIMGNHLGTMNSARSGNLVQGSEWMFETFAQWLITGKVAFNALPEHLDSYYTLTSRPRHLQKAQAILARAPHQLDRAFRRTMLEARGQIFII